MKRFTNHPATQTIINNSKIIIRALIAIALILSVFTFITSKTQVIAGIRSMVVLSGSMEPVLPVGSIIFTIPQLGYNNGDIISFTNNSRQNVTHRIRNIIFNEGETSYLTMGDANNKPDTELIPLEKVSGKVFLTIPYAGKIIAKLNTPLGFFSLILVPSIFFILMELWNIKCEIEKQTEKRLMEKLQQTEQLSF